MLFKDLYSLVESHDEHPISFEFLRQAIMHGMREIEEIKIWRNVYSPPSHNARFSLFDDRTSPYNEEYLVAEISYCSSLEAANHELRLALTKELMHVFDPRDTWIDTREKFVKFLKDLQNEPLNDDNGSVSIENRAKWMALVVLLPKPLRDKVKTELAAGNLMIIEASQTYQLPEWAIATAIDDYYDEAIDILLK